MSAKKRTASAKKKAAKKTAKASPEAKRAKTFRAGASKAGASKKGAAKTAAKKAATKTGRVLQAKRSNARPAKKATKTTKKASSVKRRDGAGHLDPKYAADLRAKSGGRDVDADDSAFLGTKRGRRKDPLAQELGEEFVETATSGEDEGTEVRDRKVVEELGGPFTVTSAGSEFAEGVDGSNPKGATREPFPRT